MCVYLNSFKLGTDLCSYQQYHYPGRSTETSPVQTSGRLVHPSTEVLRMLMDQWEQERAALPFPPRAGIFASAQPQTYLVIRCEPGWRVRQNKMVKGEAIAFSPPILFCWVGDFLLDFCCGKGGFCQFSVLQSQRPALHCQHSVLLFVSQEQQ